MRRIKSPNKEAFDDGWDKALITLERLVEKMTECGTHYLNKQKVLAQIKELRK